MDTTLVRVLWLLVVLCGGTGILLYVILWLVLPLAPPPLYAAAAPQAPIVPQPGN
jgi:phage shock protein PspC (stress-responsive transcriptional regulator)